MGTKHQYLKFKLVFNVLSDEKELLEELRQKFSLIFYKVKAKNQDNIKLSNKSIKPM